MHVIGFLKQKGGCGSTTVCVHLALAAIERGRRVCIVDVDPQQSTRAWSMAREDDAPPVIAAEVSQLPAIIEAADEDGYDLVMIDTPPHSSSATAAVARVCSLAIIPARPSALDLAALPPALQIVQATEVPTLLVLNACPARAREVDEARALLEDAPAEVWPGQLGDRTSFRRAIAQGSTAPEMDPRGKAAKEIRALWRYVDRMLAR